MQASDRPARAERGKDERIFVGPMHSSLLLASGLSSLHLLPRSSGWFIAHWYAVFSVWNWTCDLSREPPCSHERYAQLTNYFLATSTQLVEGPLFLTSQEVLSQGSLMKLKVTSFVRTLHSLENYSALLSNNEHVCPSPSCHQWQANLTNKPTAVSDSTSKLSFSEQHWNTTYSFFKLWNVFNF